MNRQKKQKYGPLIIVVVASVAIFFVYVAYWNWAVVTLPAQASYNETATAYGANIQQPIHLNTNVGFIMYRYGFPMYSEAMGNLTQIHAMFFSGLTIWAACMYYVIKRFMVTKKW